MKFKILILSLGLGGSLLMTNGAFAQDADASDEKVEKLESQLAEEKSKNEAIRAEETSTNLKDLKKAQKEAKRKAKSARNVQRDADNAAKEAKKSYKAERRAQRARQDAEKQAEKAQKAKRASDSNR